MVWLTGGALATCLAMVVMLVATIAYQGFATFWPVAVIRTYSDDGDVLMGEVTREESYRPSEAVFDDLRKSVAALVRRSLEDPSTTEQPANLAAVDTETWRAAKASFGAGAHPSDKTVGEITDEVLRKAQSPVAAAGGIAVRRSLRTGNFELTNSHFHWVDNFTVAKEDRPEWAVVFERLAKGRFYGIPVAFLIDGKEVAADPAQVWAKFTEYHYAVRRRWRERVSLERDDIGAVSRAQNNARLAVIQADLSHGPDSPEHQQAERNFQETRRRAAEQNQRILASIKALNDENDRYQIRLQTADGQLSTQPVWTIVRAYPANQLGFWGKLGVYVSRWKEFLTDEPRNVNMEGGVLPAIWGTVIMTMVMALLVVPFGVLAALYLREYAKAGPVVSAVRIAINNLAGVPSIVFGVFGLGFFCYVIGANIDQLFFAASLADKTPTFGTGGLLWASLTLALLTVPVVIVATEEALAAVPNSMREGSYACGASKWQTIHRIVLPRALPGIMTGTILAMARGAGEVAPLMLVGVVKLAPELPVDGVFPYLHAQRSFMHLGFHIYDVGFQSPNSEAAKPMVFTTTLLLIAIIGLLNVAAIWLRNRLRRKFMSDQF
jgi:phosphate transport system permease protein